MVGLRWTRAFHIPPCHVEPAAGKLLLNPAGWRGGGFPAHEKCPAPKRLAGHFRVRLSGRYNALYLAAPWGLQGVRPGTPRDPVLRLRLRWKRALTGPQACAPLPPFLPPFIGGRCVSLLGGKTRLRADEGRRTGIIAETKTAPAIPRRRCYTRDAICCECL